MSTELLHGQMSFIDGDGNVTVLHQETSASDVLVNNKNNINGADGGSAIPLDVDNLQKLTDKLGTMAFKSDVKSSDLENGLIANNYTTTEEGHALDARRGKDLNDRVKTIEDSEYVYIEDSEDGEVVLPESEINDNTVSESLTWSSDKINDLIQQILNDTRTFYVPLIENSDGSYTSQKTVSEIEEAYQNNRHIWAESSNVLLPLRLRVNATTWLFSGYSEGQAYDIQISDTGVTIIYNPVATLNDALPNPSVLKLTGAVNAVYDGSTEVEVEIPEVIDDTSESESKTWSSTKITEAISNGLTNTESALESFITQSISTHNSNNTSHDDIRELIKNVADNFDTLADNTQTELDKKANKSDIASTVMQGTAVENNTYWKISDFGNWGTESWMKKGFSMLITSRAGEMIWVSLSENDSNTSAGAIRLINRYSKIASLHYSVSESAIYVTAAGWANNICAHIISNVNGEYVPTITSASALPSDAVSINIVEFGINSTSTVVGDNSVLLEMAGSATRPTYNSNDIALYSDVSELNTRLSNIESAAVSVLSGVSEPTDDQGSDGDIYLVME